MAARALPRRPTGNAYVVLPGEEIAAAGPKAGSRDLPGQRQDLRERARARLPDGRRSSGSSRSRAATSRKPNDVVVGTVTDVQGTFWLLDIGAPRWAPLHMTGTPWKIDFGETEQYLRVGDSVVVAVESLEATGRIGVTMNGDGLGKLEGGTIVTISPAKVPRVIGRGGSMISTITRHTGAKIVVGQNGRIWVDGSPRRSVRVQRDASDSSRRRGSGAA